MGEETKLPTLARQQRQLTASSNASHRLAEFGLEPVEPETLVGALSPALALVGSAGMTASDREEWLAAACMKLEGIPEDLLREGISFASSRADHPSKIIPLMMGQIESVWMERRRRHDSETRPLIFDRLPSPAEPKPEYVTPEQARAILEEFGLKRNWS